MDETQQDLSAQILMLTHVTTALWANFIRNSGSDPLGTCQRLAEESLSALESIYERIGFVEPNPGLHPTVQRILHHEEGFWRQVEQQLRGMQE